MDEINLSAMELDTNFSVEVNCGMDAVMDKMLANDISLDTLVETNGNEKKTAMKMCLEDVNNGHEVVKKVLDKSVSRNEETGIIKVDVGNLYKHNPDTQTKVVTELIMARDSKKKDSRAFNALSNLLKHPVISSFIMEKWRMGAKLFFTIHTRVYMFFLFVYTFYLVLPIACRSSFRKVLNQSCRNFMDMEEMKNCINSSSLEQEVKECILPDLTNTSLLCSCDLMFCPQKINLDNFSIIIPLIGILIVCVLLTCYQSFKIIQKMLAKKKVEAYIAGINTIGLLFVDLILGVTVAIDRQNTSLEEYFKRHSFLQEWNNGFSVIELLFLISAFYLLMKEVLTPYTTCFRLSHCKEPKKLLEWACLASVAVAMSYKDAKVTHERNGWTAGVISCGIISGWMAFAFKTGEGRFSELGNFITMNYNILKRIFTYVVALVYFIIGFAVGFWILEHKIEKKTYHFNDSPFMTTVTMMMGEFGYREGFEEAFAGNWVVSSFCTLLLFCLIVTVTIPMLNLLLSSIIKDHDAMLKEVYVQNLVFMARFITFMEMSVYQNKLTIFVLNKLKLKSFYESILSLDEGHTAEYSSNHLCSQEFEKDFSDLSNNDRLVEELEKILDSQSMSTNQVDETISNSVVTPLPLGIV